MILILSGAGASFGIEPRKYPTTFEYFKKIPKELKDNPLFKQTENYLRLIQKKEKVDIEDMILVLEELKQFLEKTINPNNFLNYFLSSNRWFEIVSPNINFVHLTNTNGKQVRSKIIRLLNGIYEQVYNLYGQRPDEKAIKSTWVLLLKKVLLKDRRVELFTLNYDRVLEYSIELVKNEAKDLPKIEHGRDHILEPTLNTGMWRRLDLEEGGLLTKLHGSVDWSWEPNQKEIVYTSNKQFKGTHDKHTIIYPGFKGEPKIEPFISFHRYFRRMVKQAKTLLIIGYAFRDQFINEILQNNVDLSKVIIIDPYRFEKDALPLPHADITQIEDGFSENTVKQCVNLL